MNSKLIKKELKEKKFEEYAPTPLFDSDACDKCYQKRYDDEKGKKYFLDVKHYDLQHPTTGADLSGYEISTQLYLKDGHKAFNINFLSGITISEAEDFIEDLFKGGKLDYYEEWV